MKLPWVKENNQKNISFNVGLSKSVALQQALKGEISVNKKNFVTTNDRLGITHPFDFSLTEQLYKQNGIVASVVDKVVEWVWGPGFTVKSVDNRSKQIIETWMADVNFQYFGRRWLREALVKGTGFLELGGKVTETVNGIKVLNANHMFIRMNKKGETIGYTQYRGNVQQFSEDKAIFFAPHEMAVYSHSQIGDDPYGLGLIYPNLKKIDQLLQSDKDMHTILRRKANSPLVATLGDTATDNLPGEDDINSFGDKMSFMNASTEFAVSDLVKLSVIDFGSVESKFEFPIEYDMRSLLVGFQTPEVLAGHGNIPEGLAKVQLEGFDRHVRSIQEDVEKVIENDIFRRVLRANNLQVPVEIVWGVPSKSEQEKQVTDITQLLTNPMLESGLRLALEQRLAELLELKVLTQDNDDFDRFREEEVDKQPRVPGENQEHLHYYDINEYYEGRIIRGDDDDS